MNDRPVLITGSTGFVRINVRRELARRGNYVRQARRAGSCVLCKCEMGEAGRAHVVDKYSSQAVARQYHDLIASITKNLHG
jgi:predicted metal-binding protein